MNRDQLANSIKADCLVIHELFAKKNTNYGAVEDAFHNFTKGAELILGEADYNTKFLILMAYASKHIVTLAKAGAITNDKEFEERCLDIAVYMLIGRAMHKEMIKIESEEPKNG